MVRIIDDNMEQPACHKSDKPLTCCDDHNGCSESESLDSGVAEKCPELPQSNGANGCDDELIEDDPSAGMSDAKLKTETDESESILSDIPLSNGLAAQPLSQQEMIQEREKALVTETERAVGKEDKLETSSNICNHCEMPSCETSTESKTSVDANIANSVETAITGSRNGCSIVTVEESTDSNELAKKLVPPVVVIITVDNEEYIALRKENGVVPPEFPKKSQKDSENVMEMKEPLTKAVVSDKVLKYEESSSEKVKENEDASLDSPSKEVKGVTKCTNAKPSKKSPKDSLQEQSSGTRQSENSKGEVSKQVASSSASKQSAMEADKSKHLEAAVKRACDQINRKSSAGQIYSSTTLSSRHVASNSRPRHGYVHQAPPPGFPSPHHAAYGTFLPSSASFVPIPHQKSTMSHFQGSCSKSSGINSKNHSVPSSLYSDASSFTSATSHYNPLGCGQGPGPLSSVRSPQFGYIQDTPCSTFPASSALGQAVPFYGQAHSAMSLEAPVAACSDVGSLLPTAAFPLPLDPACPPTVLPCNSSTTQSSGYSTAGHSRSSSPMSYTPSPAAAAGPAPQFVPLDSMAAVTGSSPHKATSGFGAPTPNLIFSALSSDLLSFPQVPTLPGQHIVYFHINPGVTVSFTVMDQIQVIKGPITVPLVSSNSNPPIPLPMQVPPGHVVQQIVDESGTLRHVIVSHQPPILPIPAFNAGNQGQFYPPGPGFPNAHFNPMQGTSIPCGIPTSQGPSPSQPNGQPSSTYMGSLPAHAQKDERAQRQYAKLRRKLEQKQQQQSRENGTANSYHSNGSYRKENSYGNNNCTRRTVTTATSKPSPAVGHEEDGSVGSTGSVTSSGTQDEEEEHRIMAQTEMLSSLHPPDVDDVTPRSALVKWSHPDRITESGVNKFPDIDVSDSDFRYEILVNDKTRDSSTRTIIVNSGVLCRIKDLSPGTMYSVAYCAMLGDLKGSASQATNFSTLPSAPESPFGLKATCRTRNSIQLRWNAPHDNGSKITGYVVEYDEGKEKDNFVEIYKGKSKQCTVNKLQPAFSYNFRVAAINQCGQSQYSQTITVMTNGSPPSQPIPPTLAETGVTFLRLEWVARPIDDEYTLQMEDSSTGHGFISVYNGTAPNYLIIGLKPNFKYKFKLKAQNEEGSSKWSEEVAFNTLPGPPGRPSKPQLKGRIHSNSFKVKWDAAPPSGGSPVTAYILEIDQGNGGFDEIYRGLEMECHVDKLSPGQSYALRVLAVGAGGVSEPSDTCVITTDPVCPGKCHVPRVIGKPKSNSVHLKWGPPNWDGGSPVNQYEVGCTSSDNQTQEAYRGKETECTVNRLLPGRVYLFQIRAFNRIGAGPWSDPLEVVSGAGSPDPPAAPKIANKTSHMVLVSWTEPLNNGSAVTEYRVQMASPTSSIEHIIPKSEDSDSAGDNTDETATLSSSPQLSNEETATFKSNSRLSASFSQVYLGNSLSCEVKGLQPSSLHLFRVQAINSAGCSEWSPVACHQMPASSPSAVTNLEAVPSSNEIHLKWAVPNCNGSSILHYNVMLGETVFVSPSNSFTLDNLMPDTQYKIRVQAVNSIGPGAFWSVAKVSTKPLPPSPPKLECVSATHFWLKLKWSDASTKSIEYLVQMIDPYKDEFEVVYRGLNTTCKVSRLRQDTEYNFRICALNAAGQGPYSDMYRFCTTKAPPSPVKDLKVQKCEKETSHSFEWLPVCCDDIIEYQMQIGRKKTREHFKVVYRGKETNFDLKHDEVDRGMEYTARVCAIRICEDGDKLVGPYSNQVFFYVPSAPKEDVPALKSHSVSSSKSLSATTQLSHHFVRALEEQFYSISYESRVGILAVTALICAGFLISCFCSLLVS